VVREHAAVTAVEVLVGNCFQGLPTSGGHELDGKRWEQFPAVSSLAVTKHRLSAA